MDTFDAVNATAHLAAGLNINRDQVTLKVTAGSVRVEGAISFINAPESADYVRSQLSEVMSNSSRVLAIFGLPLEGVDRMPVVVHKLLLATALPPPPSPSTGNLPPVSASSDVGHGVPLPLYAALLGAGAVLLCGTLACGIRICFIHLHRGRRRLQEERAEAGPEAGAIGKLAHAAEGSIHDDPRFSEAPEWSELAPTDATSAELVFSTGKFPDRKTSAYAWTEASSTGAYEFSQLDSAERRRRRKASLCAGDETYSDATGTKDAPENPSGFRRTHAHNQRATTTPRDPSAASAAAFPRPRHEHFASTLPPPYRRHTLAATTLPPPSCRHAPPPAAAALPPAPRRQTLAGTNPPARESGDTSRNRCGTDPDGRRNTVYHV